LTAVGARTALLSAAGKAALAASPFGEPDCGSIVVGVSTIRS
jgi:hypothetical protein